MVLDGDDEDFLWTPETGRRCCHDSTGGVLEDEPECDGNPDGLKPDMVFRGVRTKAIREERNRRKEGRI